MSERDDLKKAAKRLRRLAKRVGKIRRANSEDVGPELAAKELEAIAAELEHRLGHDADA